MVEPPVVDVPRIDPSVVAQRLQAGASLARDLMVCELEAPLKGIALDSAADAPTRAAAATNSPDAMSNVTSPIVSRV